MRTIRCVERDELEACLAVIRESFATVAAEFGLTKENCPTHTSFMTIDKLQWHWDNEYVMMGCFEDGKIIGYFSLSKKDDFTFELHNLAVLPAFRHGGIGGELLAAAKEAARKLGARKLTLDIIEEHTRLKKWYAHNGFMHTGIRKFDHLPFTVGFMECTL